MRSIQKARSLVVGTALSVLVAACGSTNTKNARFAYVEEPVEQLYNNASRELGRQRYQQAVLLFGEVERQHPYSPWARRSMLMSAYAQYQANEYEDALATLDRFIALHPGNSSAPYAYYLRAMCHYERIVDVERDQGVTLDAVAALTDVVRRYPNTEYARDARLKLDLTNDHLAGKEMSIGRYYLRRNQHIAAINRFRTVIEQFQTTSHVPEALHRLVEAYLELGVVEEARAVAAVLGHNYPGNEWYEDTYRLFDRRGLLAENERPQRRSRTAVASVEDGS